MKKKKKKKGKKLYLGLFFCPNMSKNKLSAKIRLCQFLDHPIMYITSWKNQKKVKGSKGKYWTPHQPKDEWETETTHFTGPSVYRHQYTKKAWPYSWPYFIFWIYCWSFWSTLVIFICARPSPTDLLSITHLCGVRLSGIMLSDQSRASWVITQI